MTPKGTAGEKGLHYGRHVVGKHRFRVREQYLAHQLAPLIASKAFGAAKLDLVLRGLALSPDHAGDRPPGTVLPEYSYEDLHDLVRVESATAVITQDGTGEREAVRLKRKWIGDKMRVLERRNLVVRREAPGHRPDIVVLRDDGSGMPFDDPGARAASGNPSDWYVTVTAAVVASGHYARWDAPPFAAFLAATVAERYADPPPARPGMGTWWRPHAWFPATTPPYDRQKRIGLPLSDATLARGLATLTDQGLIEKEAIRRDPVTQRRLRGSRNLYRNRFAEPPGADTPRPGTLGG